MVVAIDAKAQRLGLSRDEHLRRTLAAEARGGATITVADLIDQLICRQGTKYRPELLGRLLGQLAMSSPAGPGLAAQEGAAPVSPTGLASWRSRAANASMIARAS